MSVTDTKRREHWYAQRVEGASTPKEEFEVLRSRFMADVKRLPEELRDGAYQNAVEALAGAIESISDALSDVRPMRVRT